MMRSNVQPKACFIYLYKLQIQKIKRNKLKQLLLLLKTRKQSTESGSINFAVHKLFCCLNVGPKTGIHCNDLCRSRCSRHCSVHAVSVYFNLCNVRCESELSVRIAFITLVINSVDDYSYSVVKFSILATRSFTYIFTVEYQ